MWIAITYERVTSVITWNLAPTEAEAIQWVIDSLYPKNDPVMDPTATYALGVIETLGFAVQIEEVTHLVTSPEFGVRLPNELTVCRTDIESDAFEYARQADEKLRAAGSPERSTVVSRDRVFTPWKEWLG